ncbi:MAG: hypothetical protein WBF77_00965 [Sulfurimonadaceae bacterium]
MIRFILITHLLMALLSAQELVVVVSKNFAVSSLDQATVKRLFLAKSNQIEGKKIKLIELKNSKFQEPFYKEVTGKSLSQLHAYWTTLIFTGKGRPPKRVAKIEELREKMRSEENYLAYLPREQVDKEMKVIYSLKN